MTTQQLEFYLDRGDIMGIVKQTDSEDYMGWISLLKRKINQRILNLFDSSDEEYIEQMQIKERPYVLEICELKRSAFENDNKLPEECDYRISDTFFFDSLSSINKFLTTYSVSLNDIKWISEIPSL